MKVTKFQFELIFAIGMIFHFIAIILTYYAVDVFQAFNEGSPLANYLGTGFIFFLCVFIIAFLVYFILYIFAFKFKYNNNIMIFIIAMVTFELLFDAFHDIYYVFMFLNF
jgi:glycerol-3-phosphate acyltransferase PlsY